MKLFVFAHKAEASVFINKMNFKPAESDSKGLFRNDCNLLLLTGTGLKSAKVKLSDVLSKYKDSIDEIINLGVVGDLGRDQVPRTAEVGSVVLRDHEGSIRIGDSELICLSSKTPVMDSELAKELSSYAHFVDMELWAFAEVAAEFQIRLRSIKTVSDQADEEAAKMNFKAKAQKWAQELFDFYSAA